MASALLRLNKALEPRFDPSPVISLLGRGLFVVCLILSSSITQIALGADWQPEQTEYGQPDLQGLWYFGSTTPFTRPSHLAEQKAYSTDLATE